MQFQFFHIPAVDPDTQTAALNQFLNQHRILTVEREFVADGQNSFWTLSVKYAIADATPSVSTGKRSIDYREVLNENDFAVFAKLRTLRKTLAERERVPAYALFTNEQLAKIVRDRVDSKEGLKKISGVGELKVAKYGDAFLAVAREAFADTAPLQSEPAKDETQQGHN